MWYRSVLKARAKNVLRGNYWKAFLVSLVIGIATGEGFRVSVGNSTFRNSYSYGSFGFGDISAELLLILGAIFAFFGTILIVFIGISIFILNPLEVGGRKYFIQSAQYFDNRRCFRFAFDGRNYLGIVGTMLLKKLFIFLWTLLFIIPGIVKSYAYRMVPYILADNPNIGARRAIELSNKMTYGHKWDMFVLDLSFLGWYLLGIMIFFIGGIFVDPYYHATEAELYLVLRSNAIESGMCSLWELNLYDPNQKEYNV